MRKQIYRAIALRLKQRVPEIQYIGLFNQQTQRIETGDVWPLPAVFVEFGRIEWRKELNRATRGDVTVMLHVVTRAVANHGSDDPAEDGATAFLDLIDQVNAAVTGLHGANFSAFMHAASDTDADFAECMESVETFTASAQDTSASPSPKNSPSVRITSAQ